jgi:hypothetical protein
MEREVWRGLVIFGAVNLNTLVLYLFILWYYGHWDFKRGFLEKKDRKDDKKEKVKVSEIFLCLFYAWLLMLLIFCPTILWVNYDRRQEENEPIVKQKRKWEEVFPVPIQELVSELEKRMEEEGEHHVILLEDAPSEIEDKINYFCNIWFDLGKSIIFQCLIDRNLIKRRVRWEVNSRDLKIIFLQLIEINPAEAKEKIQEIENLLQDLYDNSLRKQSREFSQLTEEEQLEPWLRNFSFSLAVSKLLIETYCFLRQKTNKGEHYLYNWRYENMIISSVFY